MTTDQEAVNALQAFVQANQTAPGAEKAIDAITVLGASIARRRQCVIDEAASLGVKAR